MTMILAGEGKDLGNEVKRNPLSKYGVQVPKEARQNLKVLLITDSPELAKNISFSLWLRWPDAIVLPAGEETQGMELLEREAPDLVMIDFSLPSLNGLQLVSQMRQSSDVPITVIMGQESEVEKVRALEVGADDCICQPYDVPTFLAKLNALLRRTWAMGFHRNGMPLTSGKLTVNVLAREVFLDGKPVKLTPHEYDLLVQLVRNEGQVLTHGALLLQVWGAKYSEDVPFLKKYIYRLRQKLNDDAANPRMLLTVRGIGYKFAKPA